MARTTTDRGRGALIGLCAAALTVVPLVGTSTASATAAKHQANPASPKSVVLPVGAETGFPFGWVMDEGTKIPLPPANDADVNQARVAHAPRHSPWRIELAAGPKAWPNACAFTNAAQLHELFPAIVGFEGKPIGTKAEILNTGGNTPNNTDCQWHLKTTFQPAGWTTYSSVEVDIEELDTGAPSNWGQSLAQQRSQAKKYPAQYAYYPNLKYGAKCFYDGNELQCLKDDFDYWVLGQKVTGGQQPNSDNVVWIDQVELPLAELIASEVSTVPA
jgi:hypothetical protein